MNSSETKNSLENRDFSNFSAANISENSIEKLTSLEKELSKDSKQDIVLVAYSPNEPVK